MNVGFLEIRVAAMCRRTPPVPRYGHSEKEADDAIDISFPEPTAKKIDTIVVFDTFDATAAAAKFATVDIRQPQPLSLAMCHSQWLISRLESPQPTFPQQEFVR